MSEPSPVCARLRERFVELLGPAAAWPGALDQLLDPAEPKPLAINFHRQVIAVLALPGRLRRRFNGLIGIWCRTPAYRAALAAPGAMRAGLDGSVTEPVVPEHQEAARARLEAKRCPAPNTAHAPLLPARPAPNTAHAPLLPARPAPNTNHGSHFARAAAPSPRSRGGNHARPKLRLGL